MPITTGNTPKALGDFAHHAPAPANANVATPDQYSAHLDRVVAQQKANYAARRVARNAPPKEPSDG